jgi:Dehydrogenase E1 component
LRHSKGIETRKTQNLFMCEKFKMVKGQHSDINIVNASTQLPHAVGAAYSLKMDKKNACAVTYFGDGGTSEVCIQKTWFYLNAQLLSYIYRFISVKLFLYVETCRETFMHH